MKDKYVLDSSIWIEIERKNPHILALVLPMIEKNETCLVDVIAAEVLRGTKTRKDYLILKDSFSDFIQLSTGWDRVSELAFSTARKGFYPPLIDLYIAQCVYENKKILVTQDRHFRQIAKAQYFEVIEVKKSDAI